MASAKPYLTLKPSEVAVVQAAATIYSAYITTGKVGSEDDAKKWIQRSIREALHLAHVAERNIVADDELS